MNARFFSLSLLLASALASPVTLWNFGDIAASNLAGSQTDDVVLVPIGTLSSGSAVETTYIMKAASDAADVVTLTAPLRRLISFVDTIVASASGWRGSSLAAPALSTIVPVNLDCHLTASDSGDCVVEAVGRIATLSGSAVPFAVSVSTPTIVTSPTGTQPNSGGPETSTTKNAAMSMILGDSMRTSVVAVTGILFGSFIVLV